MDQNSIAGLNADLASIGLPRSRQVTIDGAHASYIFMGRPALVLSEATPRLGRRRLARTHAGSRGRLWVYETGTTARLIVWMIQEPEFLVVAAGRPMAVRRNGSPAPATLARSVREIVAQAELAA